MLVSWKRRNKKKIQLKNTKKSLRQLHMRRFRKMFCVFCCIWRNPIQQNPFHVLFRKKCFSQAKSNKDKNRPIVLLDERVEVLSNVRCVDMIVIREEIESGSKNDILFLIKPDVLVTSETTTDFTDEHKKQWIESGICKEIKTLKAQATVSTTSRIRNLVMGAKEEIVKEISDLLKDAQKKLKSFVDLQP